jgi:2-oxoglutarate dehydrogenase E2 component (dihydrolipoamide succinyltransferase)
MVEVRIPPLGESVSQGVIVTWRKKTGDLVEVDETLLELETDKAAVEIPAPAAGRLEVVQPEGAEVSVGAVVARITEARARTGEPGGRGTTAPASAGTAPPDATRSGASGAPAGAGTAARGMRAGTAGAVAAAVAATAATARTPPAQQLPPSAGADARERAPAGDDLVLSPAVRRLVAERQLDPRRIPASGKGGRLTKGDVLDYLETLESPAAPARPADGAETARPTPPAPPRPSADGVERVRMTSLRRRIAARLVEAQRTAAILTTFNEIDMTAVMDLRRRYKTRFQEVHGVGLGFMSLFGRAVVQALRDVPVVNAQIDGDEIVYHKRVHLGIAVGTERGLVVPVVRDADGMTLAELERRIAELAELARAGKLMPDHLAGGTFTISNGGVYGSLLSTPILNPPQSGILGMHKIEERPIALAGQVVVRPMMYVALSYDHRLVDGEQAVTVLVRVKERLEDPARLLLEL